MAHELTPDEARDLLGAYALDALDDDERRAVERHLLTDAQARAELHALQLGAAWLEQSSERPAPEAWDRIAERLHDEPVGDAQLDDAPAPVASLSERRLRGTSRVTRLLGVAAAIVAIVVVAATARSAFVDDTPARDSALAAAAREAADQPGAQRVVLRGRAGRVTARAVVLPGGGGFVTADLPRLSERRTYELWALTDDGPVSLGVLGRAPGTRAFTARVPMSGLAVTDEPRGGSPTPTAPTGPIVASGDVSTS